MMKKMMVKMMKNFVSLSLAALMILGSVSVGLSVSAEYQATAHDGQFAEILSHKIEGIIADRGESFRPVIVTTLRQFAARFANQDARFAYIVSVTSDIIEENTGDISGANAVITGFVAKNELNESNSSLRVRDAWQNENNLNQVMLSISSNPDQSYNTTVFPTVEDGTIEANVNCVIYGTSPFPGSSTTPSIVGPRGRAYDMSYEHVNLTTPDTINFLETSTVSFDLPELPSAVYTLMCHAVIVDVVDEENNMNNMAYRSAYYYFDVEVE